jgi:hypothetical protein
MGSSVTSQPKQQGLETYRDGRDEMNLIEFPFAMLSERSGKTRVLEFQRETYDRMAGKPVVRKLTVTGDAKYGLPTAKDEEVYLALLQLTKLHSDFGQPKVYFTRSQMIKLMGWKNRDWSYHRIETAFCRLTGVRLFYENAWRDNAKKKYRSLGGFGLLDSFEIRDGRIRSKTGDETERLSEFRWNSVLFDSFQSGYLKKLDYSKVRELSTIARRMYRYLDKHFYAPHRTTLTLNLKIFAFEHIGVSRKNDSAQIRRAFSKAIEELEAIGFLIPNSRRYRKIAGLRGEWEVIFSFGAQTQRQPSKKSPHLPAASPRTGKPDRIDRYLAALPVQKRQEIESQAMRDASGFLLDTMESRDGPMADACRHQIIRAFLTKRLPKKF